MALRRWIIPFAFVLAACGAADPGDRAATAVNDDGADLFNTYCATCHGRKGNMGINGAKDLTVSTLGREEMIAVVTNGRRLMMPYKSTLRPKEIEAVVDHALSLRARK